MNVTITEQPPADFSARLTKALREIRIGDYASAGQTLDPLRRYLPKSDVELSAKPEPDEYYRLRLATLLAEVAEYEGHYEAARIALQPYRRIVRELEELWRDGLDLRFERADDARYLLLLQKIYYLWQKSVWSYRTGAITRSRELINLAIRLAERIHPVSKTLLTQLYYGAGKLAFHECREGEAMAMYRQSLMSASQRLDIARQEHSQDASAPQSDDVFMENEVEAARYSVAKTLALGLAQCLREEGRLEEAHTQVVAGRLLLNLGPDRELSQYARLLLGSIERSIAGEDRPDLLEHAGEQIAECAEYFTNHKGEVGHRSRLELALVTMQQKEIEEARRMLHAILESTSEPKWVAECNLALSRAARRIGEHREAIERARKSVQASDGMERIKRRAQTVLVLALYDAAAATEGDARAELLNETEQEIDRAMFSAADPDVRTQANMLLTRARVQKLTDKIALALRSYKEYEAIKSRVQVGRIRELARTVEKELQPVMNEFRCPADLDPPVYNLDQNIEAVRHYVIAKVNRAYETKGDQAAALGRSRGSLYSDANKPKNSR